MLISIAVVLQILWGCFSTYRKINRLFSFSQIIISFLAGVIDPLILYPLLFAGLCFNVVFVITYIVLRVKCSTTEHIQEPRFWTKILAWNFQYWAWCWVRLTVNLYTCFGLWHLSARDISWWESKFIKRRRNLRNILVPNERKINIFPCHNGHTHPRSAEFRSSANEFMTHTAKTHGFKPYIVSKSSKDECDGSRYYYHEKDYHVDYCDDPIQEDHAIIFTDVDYYANMDMWLKHWKPIMMYTLVPKQLSYRGDEFAYYIDNDNNVNYHVKGGAHYKHQLWHYHGDTVSTVDWFGAICIFDIEQREVEGDPHHRLIWLLPKARIPFLAWIIQPKRIITCLKRLNVVSGNICYLWDAVTDFLSVRSITERYSVELDGELFHSIRARLANKDTPARTSDIERMLNLGGIKPEKSGRMAPLLSNCWEFDNLTPNILSTGTFSTNFTALPKFGQVNTEDSKEVGRAVSTPLVTKPSMFASKGINPDKSCIEGRVNAPRNNIVPGRQYFKFAEEFVNLVVPNHARGTGNPISADEVSECQDGKLQRARFNDTIGGMSSVVKNKLKAFIKTEPYNAPNEPRNITTMSPELTINMSQYTIPASKYFKNLSWYGPGKSPKQTISRVRDVARQTTGHGMVTSDYARYDGSVSKFLQENITLNIMLRWLGEPHRATYKQYHKEVFKKNAITSEGVSYNAGSGTRSGSPITSYNTLKNGFNCYCALRKLGYSVAEAYAKLGLYTGDDGMTANYEGKFQDALEEVSRDLGQRCEAKTILDGEPFPYCGRYFVNPMLSDESFQDPIRTISKIHLSGNRGLSREQAAANRAHGYLSTDGLTPIIGTYCKRTLEIVNGLKFRNGTHEEKYKCSNSWPQKDRGIIRDAMAKVMGITTDELDDMDKRTGESPDLDHFQVIFSTSDKAKTAAIVDGELVGIGLHQNNIQNDGESGPSSPIVEQQPRKANAGHRNFLGKHQVKNRGEGGKTSQRFNNDTRNPSSGRVKNRRIANAPGRNANSNTRK